MQLKKKKEEGKEAAAAGRPRLSAGELRMQKDFNDLNVSDIGTFKLHQEGKLMDFDVNIMPQGGIYGGGGYLFTFHVSANYPHEPPKVKCKTKVFHPNIDLDGNVCLNILREDWKPVLNINTIIYGLNHLFVDPNVDDPLNKEAAQMMSQDRSKFERLVKLSITRGQEINGTYFPPCKV